MPSQTDFLAHLQDNNPFMNAIVKSGDDGAIIDVPAIHGREFTRLCRLAGYVLKNESTGVLVVGDPGVGKSHLLMRVKKWADQDQRAFTLYLSNLQCSPESMPAYLLKSAVSLLTWGRRAGFHETPLFRLVANLAQTARRKFDAEREKKWRDVYWSMVENVLESTPNVDPMDREIYDILWKFLVYAYQAKEGQVEARHKADLVVRWLQGDVLDPEESKEIGLREAVGSRRGGEGSVDPQQAKRILSIFTQLARLQKRPFILFLDQVDNLGEQRVFALFQFIHALLDEAPNLLVVTSGVKIILDQLKSEKFIQPAAWGRIAGEEILLTRIDPEQARALILARLDRFFLPFQSLAEVQKERGRDSLYPLGSPWWTELAGERLDFGPREVIRGAKSRWQEIQDGDEPVPVAPPQDLLDTLVADKIHEQMNRRELDPSSLPPDASNILGLMETLLGQCLGHEGYTLRSFTPGASARGKRRVHDLMVEETHPGDGRLVRTGISVVVTGSANSAAACLRRLAEEGQPPDHVLLIDEERLPLKTGEAGRKLLKQLQERGQGCLVRRTLTTAEYRQMDALQWVVGEARSGDLELGPHTVQEAEVIASHHRQDRYRGHPLLRELLTEDPPRVEKPALPPPNKKKLMDFIKGQIAITMGMSSLEMTHKYHAHVQWPGEAAALRPWVEEVLKEMHARGQLRATPMDDQLYILSGKEGS